MLNNLIMDDPDFIGDWHRERKLGSGGFGTVMLWKHRQTGQKIAIKKCHMLGNLSAETLEKQKERWIREIELMNEMTHENIVHGIKVQPESFVENLQKTVLMPGMPILVMEYCQGGDLRQYLNLPSNSNGLLESDVRNCLRCIGNAIRYLHDQKITHRDIKPENIVLNRNANDEICFKLTDLGYAKSLDRNSLNASLVGTIEYVAPELFISDKYSCTVDYWSFGIIAFEIVTGIRPFVPHLSLAQCAITLTNCNINSLITVKKKSSEHISIIETNNGDVQYLSTIFRENHISTAFIKLLEKWLQLALEWTPKQRGSVFELQTQLPSPIATNKPKTVSFATNPVVTTTAAAAIKPPVHILKLFTMLDEILAQKILSVFCLHTCQYLSYPIDEQTTMCTLRALIENDTGIPAGQIRITIELENNNLTKVEQTTRPIDLYLPNFYDKPMIYVSRCGKLCAPHLEIPQTIQEILENPKQKLKIHIYKRFAFNTNWFLRMEQQKYIEMLNGFYTTALQLNHECVEREINVQQMIRLVYSLDGASMMYRKTIEQVQKNFVQLNGELLKPYWMEQLMKMNENIVKLIVAAEKIQQRYRSALRRSHESTKFHLFAKIVQDYFHVGDFDKLFDIVRMKISKKETNDIKDLALRAYQCLKRRDQLLMDKQFLQWQNQLSAVEIEMEEIPKAIDMAIVQGEKYRSDIFAANELFQSAISNGIKRPIDLGIPLNNDYLPDIDMLRLSLSNSIENSAQIVNKNCLPNGLVVESNGNLITSDLKKMYGSDALCFGESDNALSLMEDNEQLRVTMDGLIKDIDVELSESLPTSS